MSFSCLAAFVRGLMACLSGVAQHGALCLPVDQKIDQACTFAYVIFNFGEKTNKTIKKGICGPVKHEHIAGSRVELFEVTCFLKVDC